MARVDLKLERLSLAFYLLAVIGLLMLPASGPRFHFLGIGGDKWMHVALFAGLSFLFCWNLSPNRNGIVISILISALVVVVTELAQGLVSYRSPESWDVVAGLVGAVLGAVSTSSLLRLGASRTSAGLVVGMLGIMITSLFALADLIGVGDKHGFGSLQAAGALLGTLIALGGGAVFVRARTTGQ